MKLKNFLINLLIAFFVFGSLQLASESNAMVSSSSSSSGSSSSSSSSSGSSCGGSSSSSSSSSSSGSSGGGSKSYTQQIKYERDLREGEKLIEELITIPKEKITIKTDCEEYKRKAALLKAQINVQQANLQKAQQNIQNANQNIAQFQAQIVNLGIQLRDAKADLAKKENHLNSLKENLANFQKGIVNSINGAQMGPWGDLPEGFQAGIGKNNGAFPIDPGQGLYLKDEAAINDFLAKLKENEGMLNDFKNAIRDQQAKVDDAQKNADQIKKNLDDAKKNLQNAKNDLKQANAEMNQAEANIANLNAAIAALNAMYDECEKIVHELKIQQAKADAAIKNAEKGSFNATKNPATDSDAKSLEDAAKRLLEDAKEKLKYEDFEGAKKSAEKASELFAEAQEIQKASDCVGRCEGLLAQKKSELAKSKAKNPHVDYSEAEGLVSQAVSLISQAKSALKTGNTERAKAYCAQAQSVIGSISSVILGAAGKQLVKEKAKLKMNGDKAREERDISFLDDPDIKQAFDDFLEVLDEAIGYLEDTEQGLELAEDLLELAKKYGIKIPKGAKLKDVIGLLKGVVGEAKDQTEQMKGMGDELNKILKEGLFDVLKDKLKDQLIDLTAKLAAKGLGSNIAGPLSLVLSEAWDIGEGIGNWIVDNLTEVSERIYDANKQLGICEDGQPTHAVPVIYDYYTEIVYESGTSVPNSSAKFTFNKGVVGESETNVNSGEAALSDMKYTKNIPTNIADSNVSVESDGKSCKVVRKVVDIKRICERTQIRVIVNTKLYVSCK